MNSKLEILLFVSIPFIAIFFEFSLAVFVSLYCARQPKVTPINSEYSYISSSSSNIPDSVINLKTGKVIIITWGKNHEICQAS
jgi:hypothetical protein